MSSLFDAFFRTHGAIPLMEYMGTEASVTIVSGGVNIATEVDAILRHEEAVDEFLADGTVAKKLEMQIDLLVDDASSFGGLAGSYTNATALVDGVEWAIEQIDNKTETFQRLKLVRNVPRGKHRSGFRIGQ